MNIEHKLEPIEHWIVDGKAYRMATEAELGKTVLVADLEIEKRKSLPDIERTLEGIRDSQYRFEAGGTAWSFAYVQDDSLLTSPQPTKPAPTKPIDWTKPVRTKDGRAVRMLCTDGPDKMHPIIGCISGSEDVYTWTIAGTYYECDEYVPSSLDLENAPQRIQREYWVNVYQNGLGTAYETKYAAGEARGTQCLACVKITIDCEEGEGL